MTSPQLPLAVIQHYAAGMDAVGRARLKAAQAAMSAVYRDGGHSRAAVPDATAALAYAVARMPATYAACVRSFDLVAAQAPAFGPRTALDLGAGPGTATLAALAVWPNLSEARLIEPNAALAALATAVLPTLARLSYTLDATDLTTPGVPIPTADLMTLSYVLAEHPVPQIAALVGRIAAAVTGVIVVVEPGTPAGYVRILAARDAFITAGLTILAPCPHAAPCPLPSGDWCHFSVRLQRSAGHRHLKGGEVPFEDERFSFIAAARGGNAAPERLIRPVAIEKGFADLALCTTSGLTTRRVLRRNAAAYKAAKKAHWGDAV